MPELVIARVMIKNKTAKIAYYHGTIQKCYENGIKEMLSIYFICFLSVFLSM